MTRRITVSRIVHRSRLAHDATSDITHRADGRIEDRTANGRRRSRPAAAERGAAAVQRPGHRHRRRRSPPVRLAASAAVPRVASRHGPVADHACSAGRVLRPARTGSGRHAGRAPLPRIRAPVVVAVPVY